MRSVPRRPARRTTVRLSGPDGASYRGDGDGFAAAVRDLLRRHPESPAAGGSSGGGGPARGAGGRG